MELPTLVVQRSGQGKQVKCNGFIQLNSGNRRSNKAYILTKA